MKVIQNKLQASEMLENKAERERINCAINSQN